MTLTAAGLLIISAGLHAGWNMLGKRQNASPLFMLAANTIGALLLIPALFWYGGAVQAFPTQVWGYLALTGLFQAIYYLGLANAYRCGDLSIAYPLLRAAPVLMVAFLTALLGAGAPLSWRAAAGMVLVVVSCLVLPMQRFTDLRVKNYWNLVSVFALLAACGTAGYSLVDSEALKLSRAAVTWLPGPGVTLVYALIEGLITSAWLGLFVLAGRYNQGKLGFTSNHELANLNVQWNGFLQAFKVGAGIYAAYSLVLVAMGFVTNVSYVVAFRQLSIPLGALLGMTVLHESHPWPKIAGIAGVFAGLVLVGMG